MSTDHKFQMRAPQSGAYLRGTSGNVLTKQPDGTWAGQTPTPGTSVLPEGNIYWLDPDFGGVSDGSIASPFTTFAEFWAAVVAGGAGSYALMLPAAGVAIDAALPALGAGTWTISLVGFSKQGTRLGNLVVLAQTGSLKLNMRDCHFDSWTFASGAIDMFCENVACDGCTMTAVVTGTLTAEFCDFFHLKLRQQSYVLKMLGGTLAGNAPQDTEWKDGELRDVTIIDGTTLTPSGAPRFIDCYFQPNCRIGNDHNPLPDFDPVTYDSTFQNGTILTFVAKTYTPNMPRIALLANNTGTNIPAGTAVDIDFGNASPRAEPDSPIVGSWAASPAVPLVISRVIVDAGTGRVTVTVANTDAVVDHALPTPARVSVAYLPRFTP